MPDKDRSGLQQLNSAQLSSAKLVFTEESFLIRRSSEDKNICKIAVILCVLKHWRVITGKNSNYGPGQVKPQTNRLPGVEN